MSSIYAVGLPGCCVGVVLNSFGGSSHRRFEGSQSSIPAMKKRIKYLVDNGEGTGGYGFNKMGAVIATLTTEQEDSIKCLEQIGFERKGQYEKAKHPDSDLLVFVIGGKALYDWAKNYVEPPKRETFNLNKTPTVKRATPAPAPVAAPAWDEEFEEEDI